VEDIEVKTGKNMPPSMPEANEICSICGRPIRTHRLPARPARFPATAKNRFFYGVCNPCQRRVNEERRKLGLEVKRKGETLSLYAKARYLIEQGLGISELNKYVEWMNHLVTQVMPEKKPLVEYESRLAEVGILEQTVSRAVADISIPLDYLERLRGSPFFDEIDRAQRKRELNARKLYAKRKSLEMTDRPLDLQIFDVLFDPF
jgi:hypothetical protein